MEIKDKIKLIHDNYQNEVIGFKIFNATIADLESKEEVENFETLTTEKLLLKEFSKIKWIVEDYIPLGGCVLLSGEPKAGKSIVALDLCRSVIGNEQSLWLDNIRTSKGKIFYIDAENPEILIQERLRIMKVPSSPDFHIVNRNSLEVGNIDLTDSKTYSKIKNKLIDLEFTTDDLIVFDSLRRLHSGEENDSTSISKIMALINGISPASKLVLHHLRKKNQFENSPNDRIRGSADILAAVDGNIAVTTEGEGSGKITKIEMSAPRWSEGKPPFDVEWLGNENELKLKTITENFTRTKNNIDDIARMISKTGEPLTLKEICNRMKMPRQDVSKALTILINEKLIKTSRTGGDYYYLRKKCLN